jgi:hypothetical protein
MRTSIDTGNCDSIHVQNTLLFGTVRLEPKTVFVDFLTETLQQLKSLELGLPEHPESGAMTELFLYIFDILINGFMSVCVIVCRVSRTDRR